MKIVRLTTLTIAAAIGLSLITSVSVATEYTKQTSVTYFGRHATRPIEPSLQNREFIDFAPGANWSISGGSGGGPCLEDAAVLPEDDSTMRAIALVAVATGATLIVNVDNSLPTVLGRCQITTMYLAAQ
jgi:hypothetical protein